MNNLMKMTKDNYKLFTKMYSIHAHMVNGTHDRFYVTNEGTFHIYPIHNDSIYKINRTHAGKHDDKEMTIVLNHSTKQAFASVEDSRDTKTVKFSHIIKMDAPLHILLKQCLKAAQIPYGKAILASNNGVEEL